MSRFICNNAQICLAFVMSNEFKNTSVRSWLINNINSLMRIGNIFDNTENLAKVLVLLDHRTFTGQMAMFFRFKILQAATTNDKALLEKLFKHNSAYYFELSKLILDDKHDDYNTIFGLILPCFHKTLSIYMSCLGMCDAEKWNIEQKLSDIGMCGNMYPSQPIVVYNRYSIERDLKNPIMYNLTSITTGETEVLPFLRSLADNGVITDLQCFVEKTWRTQVELRDLLAMIEHDKTKITEKKIPIYLLRELEIGLDVPLKMYRIFQSVLNENI